MQHVHIFDCFWLLLDLTEAHQAFARVSILQIDSLFRFLLSNKTHVYIISIIKTYLSHWAGAPQRVRQRKCLHSLDLNNVPSVDYSSSARLLPPALVSPPSGREIQPTTLRGMLSPSLHLSLPLCSVSLSLSVFYVSLSLSPSIFVSL